MAGASKRARRGGWWPILLLMSLALGCGLLAAGRIDRAAQAEADIEALRQRANAHAGIVYIRLADAEESLPASAGAWETPVPEDPAAMRIRALQQENPALVGWLKAEAAGVDYPVMQSPGAPNYYLDHDFYGRESKAGLPYVDEACDAYTGVNRIVYGHNMNNGTMFGSLKRYLDAEFYAANPTFRFDTAAGCETYRVIAVYKTVIDENAAFRFYTYTDIADEDSYRAYVAGVMARCVHGAGEMPRWGQKLLTLVTCVRYHPEERLVLVGAEVPA